jgi:hypothetical protein
MWQLNLPVGKASGIIFIEELACFKNCVLRLPRMLIRMQKTNKEIETDFHTNSILELTAFCRRLSRG